MRNFLFIALCFLSVAAMAQYPSTPLYTVGLYNDDYFLGSKSDPLNFLEVYSEEKIITDSTVSISAFVRVFSNGYTFMKDHFVIFEGEVKSLSAKMPYVLVGVLDCYKTPRPDFLSGGACSSEYRVLRIVLPNTSAPISEFKIFNLYSDHLREGVPFYPANVTMGAP